MLSVDLEENERLRRMEDTSVGKMLSGTSFLW